MKKIDDVFTDELIETTYLYAYKKVFDKLDAEDLAQNILVTAMDSFLKADDIKNFYGWFWRVARNELIRYIASKQNRALKIENDDMDMVAYYNSSVDEDAFTDICRETAKVISRLSKQHREIIILFYLQELSIKEISTKLGIPIGTVKRRLYDARKNSKKERIKMVKTDFQNSYIYKAPSVVWKQGYSACQYGRIHGTINKSIMVICSDEPMTINEIGDKMNTSPIYLEDELNYLVKYGFLKKMVNKYLTNVIMLDQKVYHPVQCKLKEYYSDFTKDIIHLIDSKKYEIMSLDFYGKDLGFDILKWNFIPTISGWYADLALKKLTTKVLSKNFDKWDKDWRVYGVYTNPEDISKTVMGRWSNIHKYFITRDNIKIEVKDMFDYWPFEQGRSSVIKESNIDLITNITSNPNPSLTEKDKLELAELIKCGLVSKTNNGYKLKIPLFDGNVYYSKIYRILEVGLIELVERYALGVMDILEQSIKPYIREDLNEQFYNWLIYVNIYPIRFVVDEIIDKQLITMPSDFNENSCSQEYWGLVLVRV